MRTGGIPLAPEECGTIPVWAVATISVILLAFLYDRRRRTEARVAEQVEQVLIDDSGFAEISIPGVWEAAPQLSPIANLKAKYRRGARYMITISESRADFEQSMTPDSHSALTRGAMGSRVNVLSTRGPFYRLVGGYEAVQYELDVATKGQVFLTYLHTTVAGARAFHQILCWSPRSRYDRPEFERLLDGFKERPGPPPAPPPHQEGPIVVAVTGSAYDVH